VRFGGGHQVYAILGMTEIVHLVIMSFQAAGWPSMPQHVHGRNLEIALVYLLNLWSIWLKRSQRFPR